MKKISSMKIPGLRFEFREKKHRMSLTLIFSLIVFMIVFTAIVVAVGLTYLLVKLEIIVDVEGDIHVGTVFLFVTVFSLVVGAATTFFSSHIPLKPVNTLINKMNRLAAGDFQTRLEFDGALGGHPAVHEISQSFNKMAEELEGTEMLRSDFINNFSHEFKTPIVSIAGLASLLEKGNLSEEQRTLYLRSIREESMRLSAMATNVLNLTKVENQTILTDVSSFNLSEQIRSAVLLLENKWTGKNIDLQLEFGEFEIEANEELLKQVWINLFDNAVKFSPAFGTVTIRIEKTEDVYSISFTNAGDEISPENRKKIFHKFYQGDESHASEGNGIGLAIVKRVVELHGGRVEVFCANGAVKFEVQLPIHT